ncbi:MAG: GDP-mannose 4,6-dehydratase [Bryobacterales bacterium]|nr:GDP-mannose 4,6-dehydratase [Bryobacterales bacterium]
MKTALVTGGAGFIGSHVAEWLLERDWRVVAVDNFDPFYDPATKRANLRKASRDPRFTLIEADIRDAGFLGLPLPPKLDVIVHLAAKAGVRPSIDDPLAYQQVNVAGTQNVLELARHKQVPRFVFASSSSVYGENPNVPWSEADHVLLPVSPYAGTKVSGELMGHVYSQLFGIRFLALRFFTVFGPRQRPDLAIHKFARLLLAGGEIPVFGDGSASRDYTYIDDIVAGIGAAIGYQDSSYEVFNLGSDRPVALDEVIRTLETVSAIGARRRALPAQPGDVPRTWANISKASRLLGYAPQVSFADGIARFWRWFAQAAREVHA